MSFLLEKSGLYNNLIKLPAITITVFVTALLILFAGPAQADQAVVKEDGVNLRAAPVNGIILGKAMRGDALEVLGKEGDWYRVSRNGMESWIAGWLVEVRSNATPTSGRVVVKEDGVNLRAAPVSGAILGRAMRGDNLEVLGREGDWYRVRRNGTVCWVAGWLVEAGQSGVPAAAGPVPSAPAGQASQFAEITAAGVNVRSGPGTGYGIAGQVNTGEKYSILEKSGDWFKISLSKGPGWVYGQYVRTVPPAASRGSPVNSNYAVVNSTGVNIRNGPGTNYQVVSRANRGERYLLADNSADWYKIVLDNGNTGWVYSGLVEVDPNYPPGSQQPPANQSSPGAGGGQGIVPPTAPGSGVKPKDSMPQPKTGVPLKSLTARLEGVNTVLSIQTNKTPINYTVNSLENPDRLVIDLNGIHPGSVPEKMGFSSPLVSGVRVGWFGRNPDVTRVVIDLKAPVRYEKILSTGSAELRIVLSPRQARSLSGIKIVLDPGHGGNDPGAIGPTGLKEKDVNLAIALKTADLLRKQGAVVTLTRSGDTSVDLFERPKVAQRNGSELFLSIHSNSNPSRDASGTSTYYLQDSSPGTDLVKFEGTYLSRCIQSSLTSSLKTRNLGVLRANFAVLTRSKVPAALVEVAFISNPAEEKLLRDDSFRTKAAQAIAQGIANYFAGK